MKTSVQSLVSPSVGEPQSFLMRHLPWMVMVCNGLFLLYKYVLAMSPSVMTGDLLRQFHLTGAGLGNLAATYFYTYLVVQLFVGPLLDRYSPRYLTSGAVLLCALGAWFFADATSLWQAELARAAVGAGVAFATVSYLKQAAVWFTGKRLAFVSGLLATSVGVGALVGQAPLSYLVAHVGWRDTLHVCALLGVVVALLYVLVVRDRKVTAPSATKVTFSWRHVLGVLRRRQNWLLTFYSGLAFSPMAVFGGLWGNPFLQSAYHLSKTQAAGMVTVSFVGLGLGAPFFGWLADRLGCRMRVMVSGTVLSLFALLAALYLPANAHVALTVVLFLFGAGTGSFMLGFAVGKEMNLAVMAATVVAMVNTGDALFGAVTEPLVGFFLDKASHGKMLHGVATFSVQNYHQALLLLPVYLLAALGFAAWLMRTSTAD